MKKRYKNIIIVIILGILIYKGFSIYRNYAYFKSDEYSYIQNSLAKITLKLLDSEMPFYEPDAKELWEFLLKEMAFHGILNEPIEKKFLEDNIEHLHFKSIPDSNALILYHAGFDCKNNYLGENTYFFERISFLDFITKPKGDAIVFYLLFHELCETPNAYLRTFYNDTISFMMQELESVSIRDIKPAIQDIDCQQLDCEEGVCLLFQFDFFESTNSWSAILLKNEKNNSANTIKFIQDTILEILNTSNLSQFYDRIVFPVVI